MKKNVLIVDDSLYMRMVIKEILEDAGYVVVGLAVNGEEAIELAFELQPDYITLDNILPDMVGTDILKVYKQEGIESKVVIISAVAQQSTIDEGMSLGAHSYVVKPFSKNDLVATMESV
ncbi:MAG: response regulator [Cyclobacteriaceae bacterium]|nr:response regulator [Cyclobacteriaceae bacterium]